MRILYDPNFPLADLYWGNRGGPRKVEGDAFQSLLDDLREKGMQNPIWCRTEEYGIVVQMGRQRCWAASLIGWEVVPTVIWDRHDYFPNAEELDILDVEHFFDDNHYMAHLPNGTPTLYTRTKWKDKTFT